MNFFLSSLTLLAPSYSLTRCGFLLEGIFDDDDDDSHERSHHPRHRPDSAEAQKVIL